MTERGSAHRCPDPECTGPRICPRCGAAAYHRQWFALRPSPYWCVVCRYFEGGTL